MSAGIGIAGFGDSAIERCYICWVTKADAVQMLIIRLQTSSPVGRDEEMPSEKPSKTAAQGFKLIPLRFAHVEIAALDFAGPQAGQSLIRTAAFHRYIGVFIEDVDFAHFAAGYAVSAGECAQNIARPHLVLAAAVYP